MRKTAYKVLKILNDVNSVRTGNVGKRVGRRVAGKATGKAMKRLFK